MESETQNSNMAGGTTTPSFGVRLRVFVREFGASVDRYLNRLYESLPKDRPHV